MLEGVDCGGDVRVRDIKMRHDADRVSFHQYENSAIVHEMGQALAFVTCHRYEEHIRS